MDAAPLCYVLILHVCDYIKIVFNRWVTAFCDGKYHNSAIGLLVHAHAHAHPI